MKFSSIVSLALASTAYAVNQGFNIAAYKPDGTPKLTADWENNFNVMKGLAGGATFNRVRVYASSDFNTLQNAVPAAQRTGIKILAGVWATDETHYTNEKNALVAAIKQYGSGWLSSISVGSEDLYRGDTTATRLAQQINEVRNLVKGLGVNVPVGHVDTWTAWTNNANAAVIKAVDFVGFDGYPYYQDAAIGDAKSVFDTSIQVTKNAIAKNKPGTPIWITETGWPVKGPTMGASVPSIANAQSYWKNVWCQYPNAIKFYFTLRDYNVDTRTIPSFGVVDVNFKPIFNLAC